MSKVSNKLFLQIGSEISFKNLSFSQLIIEMKECLILKVFLVLYEFWSFLLYIVGLTRQILFNSLYSFGV